MPRKKSKDMKTLTLGALKGYSDSRLRTLVARRLKIPKEDFQNYSVLVAYEEEIDWCRGFFFLLKNKRSGMLIESHGYQETVNTKHIVAHLEYFERVAFLHLNINGKSIEELREFRDFLRENKYLFLESPKPVEQFKHKINLDVPEGEKI